MSKTCSLVTPISQSLLRTCLLYRVLNHDLHVFVVDFKPTYYRNTMSLFHRQETHLDRGERAVVMDTSVSARLLAVL